MSKQVFASVGAVVALCGTAFATPVTNSSITNRNDILVSNGFQTLDLSSRFGAAMIGAGLNEFVSAIDVGSPFVMGEVKVEFFGRGAGVPNSSLDEVMMIYTLTTTSGTPIESVEFGVNTTRQVAGPELLAATQGAITSETTLGQSDAAVDVFINAASNDTWKFDFGDLTSGDPLSSGESYTWYVRTDAAVAVNFVEVRFTDGGFAEGLSLALVNDGSQDNLNVPAPGVLAVVPGVVAVATRRRRK